MALVIANQETVYELVDGNRTLKSTTENEVMTYTLEELEALDPKAHRKAIENVLAREWEWFEPEFVTEDMRYDIEETFPAFELDNRTLEWDLHGCTAKGRGTVNVRQYLIDHRLRNRYRALWIAIDKYDLDPDVEVTFGIYRNGTCDMSEAQRDIDYVEDVYENGPRYQHICHQLNLLEADIADWMDQIHKHVRDYLRAEENWRMSDEFALGEADAHELTFLCTGEFYANATASQLRAAEVAELKRQLDVAEKGYKAHLNDYKLYERVLEAEIDDLRSQLPIDAGEE